MSEKVTIQDIIELLAEKHSMTKKDAEIFVKGMFELIEEALVTEKYVKVKGLGTFKLTEVESRESVNVNTGERIEIQGHTKISFTPDSSMKDLINKPFAHFETVILNENTKLEDTETEIEGEEEDTFDGNAPKPKRTIAAKEVEFIEAENTEDSPNENAIAAEDTTPVIEETTETQEISEEKKNRVSRGVILAIILIACIAGGIYWYLQSDKTSDLQSPATIKNTQEQLEEDIPAIPVNDSLMQGKDTANIWTNVAGKETISQSQQTVSPSTEKSSGVATTANVAKETLADTVEYDITGTKTNYTLREGESLVKLAVKFYGTKKLWPYIVKHNKNIIKDADRVPIGTTLRIPELTPKK